MQYQEFLESKASSIQATGFKPDRLNPNLFLFQRDIVEWALQLWSNPNDLIFDPFNGIGSSGVVALEMGRRYVGSELKESYYQQAKLNLEIAASKKNQLSLFDV